jgi:hypothetical protein
LTVKVDFVIAFSLPNSRSGKESWSRELSVFHAVKGA